MKVKHIREMNYEINGHHEVAMVLLPNEMELNDPFLFMADDLFPEETFGPHPHRGIETITYAIDGEVHHHDTDHGNGMIHAGDVQWMTAGRGVLHSEEPTPGGRSRVLQLWLNLPSEQKMCPSNYQNLFAKDMPKVNIADTEFTIFSGSLNNVYAPTKNIIPVNMYDVKVKANTSVTFDVDSLANSFLFVVEGSGIFGSNKMSVNERSVIHFETGEMQLTIEAQDKNLHFVYYSGRPIKEPIVARGPFVMNTNDEIKQAYQDYRDGYFHKK